MSASVQRRIQKNKKNYKCWKLKPNASSLNNKNRSIKYYPLAGAKVDQSTYNKLTRLPAEYREIFKEIRSNRKKFNIDYHSNRPPMSVQNFQHHLVFDLIPERFYGCTKNQWSLHKILTLTFTRSRNEFVYKSALVKEFDIHSVPWLGGIDNVSLKRGNLLLGIELLLDLIIMPMFKQIYYTLYHKNGVDLLNRQKWNRFLMKVKNQLIRDHKLIPMPLNQVARSQISGLLKVFPKNGLENPDEVRVIVGKDRNNSTISTYKKKYINRVLYSLAKTICKASFHDFEKSWGKYVNYVKDQKIFAVKLDISDCFGTVNLEILFEIFEKYKSQIPEDVRIFLENKIRNQYVYFGKHHKHSYNVYKWNHGLLQGETFSCPLTIVYLAYMDSKLKQFFRNPFFFNRKMDDYLFCSIDKKDVRKFITYVKTLVKINEEKTQTNIDADLAVIEYHGLSINLDTRQVRKLYKFKKQTMLHHICKIWNTSGGCLTPKRLLTRAVHYPYNNLYFTKVFFSKQYNTKKTILENYFVAMVRLALRFDCAVMAASFRCPKESNLLVIEKVISNTVYKYAYKVHKIMANEDIHHNELIKVGYNAFCVALKRRHAVYKTIITNIYNVQKRNYVKDIQKYEVNKFPHVFRNIVMKRTVPKDEDCSEKLSK